MAMAYVIFKGFSKYEAAVEAAKVAASAVALLTTETNKQLAKNSASMDANTKGVNDQTEYMKKFGSDPYNLCKFKLFLEAKGLDVSDAEVQVRHFKPEG